MLTQEQIQQIYWWWHIFKNDNELVEIRCIGGKMTFSGYYRNIENLIRDVDSHDNYNVYFTINPIVDSCHGRPQCEQMIKSPQNTTTDADIVGRRWVFIDFDCEKVANVNSTDEEKELAHQKAIAVYKFLKEQGFNDPVIVDSSNGFHAYYACKLKPTEENDLLISRFLKALAMLFSDEHVGIDVKTANRARVAKLAGTYSRKGSALSEDRPQRMCRILKVPPEILPTSKSYFQKIADLFPEEEIKPTKENHYSTEKFDLPSFLQKHNIAYKVENIAGGTKYVLDHCVFDESHRGKDAVIFQRDNGAIAYHCFHSHCQNYKWSDVRIKFEPDAYDKKDYEDFQFKQQRQMSKYQLRPVPMPLQATEEKGAIWLKMSQIKRPKFSLADYIPSGVEQIDKLIVGFKRKHVSVWSGYRGCGKSSLLNMLILNAAQRGYKSALWTGELDGDEEKKWLYLQAAGKTYNRMTTVKDFYYTPDNICDKIDPWIDQYMWIFNNQYGNNFTQIVEQLKQLKREQDLDVAIFDNLMTLDIDDLNGDKNDRQKNLMQTLTETARELDIHIHIVAHPNKSGTFLRPNNISGTGHIPDLAQNVFIIHRINQDFHMDSKEFLPNSTIEEILNTHCTNCIEICKCRDKGSAVDKFIKLFFEMESNRLKNDIAENIQYGWNPENAQQSVMPQDGRVVPSNPMDGIMPNTGFDPDPELPFNGSNGDEDVPF